MIIRIAEPEDAKKIKELYQQVARSSNTIIRLENEITDEYVEEFIKRSLEKGLILVAEHEEAPGKIIGEIHAYSPGIHAFRHIFSNLTIAVHPNFQGRKIGRTIFTIFQEEIALNKTDIGKVELIVRESNTKAIQFYQALGFQIEGRFEMRIRTAQNTYEADIPMSWQNPNFEFD
ncbi:GNAT family N-acetyltransferase [Chryseosolibacter indicus]|uniref:GNAT family N-acetyltransferase n=1 Tax=Chryseosolibacter indicus TaxID=2782351 RepID=A0ABS5VQW8_9BACT|nr:N-acetyltransferase [Chryseosolibacter indicus]MBT1703832.1 GNAT family N-acetyltransferase [Chryseosolibacter indicus]